MLIDVNCCLGHWPFMRFRQNTAAQLARHLKAQGIAKACVWAIENVLYPDPHVVNLELMKKLKPQPMLHPVPVVNPTLSHGRECLAAYDAAGAGRLIRVLPNYHRYGLNDAAMLEFMGAFAKGGKRTLMVQMRVEDERNQYPLMKVPGVSADDVIALAKRFPKVNILCLCPYYAEAVKLTTSAKNVYADISFSERLNTLKTLLAEAPADRLCFGSHTPVLYTASSLMKLQHAEAPKAALRKIASGNAAKLTGLS